MDSEEDLRIVRKNQCGGCGKYFSGNLLFEQHRIGTMENGRRCMTTEELIANGVHWEYCLVNMILENKRYREKQAVWYDVARREKVRAAFRKDEEEENEQ